MRASIKGPVEGMMVGQRQIEYWRAKGGTLDEREAQEIFEEREGSVSIHSTNSSSVRLASLAP